MGILDILSESSEVSYHVCQVGAKDRCGVVCAQELTILLQSNDFDTSWSIRFLLKAHSLNEGNVNFDHPHPNGLYQKLCVVFFGMPGVDAPRTGFTLRSPPQCSLGSPGESFQGLPRPWHPRDSGLKTAQFDTATMSEKWWCLEFSSHTCSRQGRCCFRVPVSDWLKASYSANWHTTRPAFETCDTCVLFCYSVPHAVVRANLLFKNLFLLKWLNHDCLSCRLFLLNQISHHTVSAINIYYASYLLTIITTIKWTSFLPNILVPTSL